MRSFLFLPLLAALVACVSNERSEDQGRVCFGTDAPAPSWGRDSGDDTVSLQPGEEFPVAVIFAECASGSTDWKEQSCTLVTSGDEVTVTTYARTVTPASQTDDCQFISYPCGTLSLDEGSWTLRYGQSTDTLDIPYEGELPCISSP